MVIVKKGISQDTVSQVVQFESAPESAYKYSCNRFQAVKAKFSVNAVVVPAHTDLVVQKATQSLYILPYQFGVQVALYNVNATVYVPVLWIVSSYFFVGDVEPEFNEVVFFATTIQVQAIGVHPKYVFN